MCIYKCRLSYIYRRYIISVRHLCLIFAVNPFIELLQSHQVLNSGVYKGSVREDLRAYAIPIYAMMSDSLRDERNWSGIAAEKPCKGGCSSMLVGNRN
jgi:hypothetical protein